MISHSPGATSVQQIPPGRQCDVGGIPFRLEVRQTIDGECIQTIEPTERRLRRRPGVRRVQKHDVEPHAGRRHPGERICADDFHVFGSESVNRSLERRGDASIVLDHDDRPGATRCRLNPERPGPGEEIEAARAFDRGAKPVEQGFAYPVRSGAKPSGGEHRQ